VRDQQLFAALIYIGAGGVIKTPHYPNLQRWQIDL